MTSLASHTSLAPFADRTGHSRDLGFSPDRLARISGWMRRYVEAGKLPYVSVLVARQGAIAFLDRSEEHTSELQSLMRISYAVFCLKKKNKTKHHIITLSLITISSQT